MTDARTSEIEKAAELAIDKQCGGRYTMAVGNINIPSFTYDFIAALSAEGLVVVPREATDWMCEKALTFVPPLIARPVYRAMIAATDPGASK